MATDYKELARQARIKILEMIHRGQTSHIASNFSVVDVATVLYENLKPEDEVVWSKAWAAAAIYYFLAKQGKIPEEDLDKFPNPPYIGLAETGIQGVWVSGGSMGHGLPIAVGMALAKKRAGEEGKIYCIMSDGEMNEGTTWESAALAAHHKLDNLHVIIDKNGWQAMGRTADVIKYKSISKIWHRFKWHARVCEGHNYENIEEQLLRSPLFTLDSYKPQVLVAKTIKGRGVSFFENHLLYHYKHVDGDEYKKALAELA